MTIRGHSVRDYGDGWTSKRSYVLRGRVEDDGLRGSIAVAEIWDGGREGRTRCSGDVTFTAQR